VGQDQKQHSRDGSDSRRRGADVPPDPLLDREREICENHTEQAELEIRQEDEQSDRASHSPSAASPGCVRCRAGDSESSAIGLECVPTRIIFQYLDPEPRADRPGEHGDSDRSAVGSGGWLARRPVRAVIVDRDEGIECDSRRQIRQVAAPREDDDTANGRADPLYASGNVRPLLESMLVVWLAYGHPPLRAGGYPMRITRGDRRRQDGARIYRGCREKLRLTAVLVRRHLAGVRPVRCGHPEPGWSSTYRVTQRG
jgi:hypothetical protein